MTPQLRPCQKTLRSISSRCFPAGNCNLNTLFADCWSRFRCFTGSSSRCSVANSRPNSHSHAVANSSFFYSFAPAFCQGTHQHFFTEIHMSLKRSAYHSVAVANNELGGAKKTKSARTSAGRQFIDFCLMSGQPINDMAFP